MSRRPLLVVDEFLGGQPAHALDEGAFDLADIDRRIDGAPDVVEDIDAADAHLAGEDIDHDLAAGRAVGEIEERPAFALLAIPDAASASCRSRPPTDARARRAPSWSIRRTECSRCR